MGVFDVYSWMYRVPVHLLLIRVNINNSYLYRKRIQNGPFDGIFGGIRPRLKRKICWQWTWSTIELVLKIENIHVKELIGIKKRNLKSIKEREGQGERTFADVFGTSKSRTSEQRNNYWKLSLLWHEGQTESK